MRTEAQMIDFAQFDGHTKGPWFDSFFNGNPDDMGLDQASPRVIATAPDTAGNGKRWYIAAILQGEKWSHEDEANARLIAAAPDLLKELKTACRVIAEIEKVADPDVWEHTTTPFAIIRRIISESGLGESGK